MDESRIISLQEKILVKAENHELINVREFSSGFALDIIETADQHAGIILPPSAVWTNKEIHFLPVGTQLNEFGYLYIGLYILGNFARYHPDRWMVDVEAGSLLSLTAEEFLSIAEWRMALLTLSELSETYYVPVV